MIRKIKRNIKLWWRNRRNPPAIVISYSGQLTDTPHVHVSAHGITGAQTVYTWDVDDQGNAMATMYGTNLARILQRRLVDQRTKMEAEHG